MKRALLILLALTMIASMTAIAPLGVAAEEEELDVGTVAADYKPEGTAINSAADFAAMTADGKYYLTADITIDATWKGSFTGTFDGNGKTITTTVAPLFEEFNGTLLNLTTAGDVTATANYTGVIANTGATAKDVAITNVANNVNITGNKAPVAGFIGILNNNKSDSKTVFTNCANYGNITGGNFTNSGADCSAFVSRVVFNEDTEEPIVIFSGCVNYGTMNATGRVGAFVAYSDATLKLVDCVNNGALQAINGYTGGLVGRIGGNYAHESVIENCVNNGDILSYYAQGGGIVGYIGNAAKMTFKNCVNNGNVDFKDAGAGANIGGIMGASDGNTVKLVFENCSNNGDIASDSVTAGNINAGGIAGYTPSTDLQIYVDCVNNGDIYADVNGGSIGGGIVGRCYPTGSGGYKFDGCVNNGNVKSNYVGGGVVGAAGYDSNQNNLTCRQFIRCGNTGNVTTGGQIAGGIVGHVELPYTSNTPFVAKYCFNTGNVYSPSRWAGGIFGGDRDAGSPYLLNVRYIDIEYCYIAGEIRTGRAAGATAIANGGSVSRAKIYSYTGATGTRYFYGPQAGTVAIDGDKVTWTSSSSNSYKLVGTVVSGTTVTAAGNYKVTVDGKDYVVYLNKNEKFEVLSAEGPVFAINGNRVYACEYTPGPSATQVTLELDTFAAEDFTPYAAAIGTTYVASGYVANNYVVDGAACADYIGGAFATIFAYNCLNATRVTAEDIASGKIAYAINQAAGEDIFFQNLDPELFELDAYPTVDKTHAKVVEVGGKLTNEVFDTTNDSGSPATGDATVYVVVALAVSTIALAGFMVAKKVKEN